MTSTKLRGGAIFLTVCAMLLGVATQFASSAAAMDFMQVSTTYPQIVDSTNQDWVRFRGADYNLIEYTTLNPPQQEDVDNIAGTSGCTACMGFSVIRFPINWNFLEPSPGLANINWGYVDQIVSFVQMAENDGVYVIIDMSQWNTSQCFSALYGNGFPGWVVDDMLGTYGDGNCAYMNALNPTQGSADFWTEFWQNPTIPASAAIDAGYGNTVWDAYSYIWRVVAWQLRNYPNVLGWDIMNEPEVGNPTYWSTLESSTLPNFYEYVGTRIRWSDWASQYNNMNHILFFEGIEGATDSGLVEPSFPSPANIALAPHAYPPQSEWKSCEDLSAFAHTDLDWAATRNLPVIFGEFGADSEDYKGSGGPTFAADMSHIISVNGQSWIWWNYEPYRTQPGPTQPTFSLAYLDANLKAIRSYTAVADLKKNINIYSGTECP
jgi:hypothetical protein